MIEGDLFRVLLHQDFWKDLVPIPQNMSDRILDAIEDRLGRNPARYGERLRQSLRGYWKLRGGDYRAVYEILGQEVRVYGVMHRRHVYTRLARRLARGWEEA